MVLFKLIIYNAVKYIAIKCVIFKNNFENYSLYWPRCFEAGLEGQIKYYLFYTQTQIRVAIYLYVFNAN